MPTRYPRVGRTDECLRICLARLLGRPPSATPHFVHAHGRRWLWHLQEWCRVRRIICIMVNCRNDHGRPASTCVEGIHRWIEMGRTRTGTWHAQQVGQLSSRVVEWDGTFPLRVVTNVLFLIPGPGCRTPLLLGPQHVLEPTRERKPQDC